MGKTIDIRSQLTTLLLAVFMLSHTKSEAQEIGFRNPAFQPGDTAAVRMYIKRAYEVVRTSKNIEKMKSYIDSAEMVCVDNNIDFPASLNLVRSEYFMITGDYRSASEDATMALKKASSTKDESLQVQAYILLGRYNLRTGFFSESIDDFNSATDIARKKGMHAILPKVYFYLKDVYAESALNDLPKFRSTLTLVISAAEKEKDSSLLKAAFWRLGTSYTDKEPDYRLADSLLRKCLEISIQTKDTSFTGLSLSNLGWNYYRQKKYDYALKYYNRSLAYTLPAKIHGNSANNYGNIGTIYRDIGQKEESIKNYKLGIEQATIVNDLYSLSWIHDDMSQMYLKLGDTARAYNAYVLFKKYSDEQLKKTSSQGLAEARIRYEADAHRKEMELLSLRLRNHKLLIYGSSGLLVLSLAIGLLLLGRSKIKAEKELSEMKRKISEVTQANLRQQMNPHFIFNTLNSIQYYMYQHDKLATNNYLTKFSSLMRKVLENSQHTSVPLRDELDALNLYLELETIRFKNKFEYRIVIDDDIDTLLYKVPTMLIQPYVENSICHGLMPSEKPGKLNISLNLEHEYIRCTIEDNGIGREAAQARKARNGENHNSLGTQIVSSRLELVNALYGTSLKTIFTDLRNENGEAEGTRVEIHIPILS